jgi:hypothetical protein
VAAPEPMQAALWGPNSEASSTGLEEAEESCTGELAIIECDLLGAGDEEDGAPRRKSSRGTRGKP